MALVPGWDSKTGEEVVSSPKAARPTVLSASASLNAAVLAKKEREQQEEREKAEKAAKLAALSEQPLDANGKPTGWWNKMDAGLMNKDNEDLDKKQKQSFTPQVAMGIGSSLFNIARSGSMQQPSSPSATAASAPAAAPEADAVAPAAAVAVSPPAAADAALPAAAAGAPPPAAGDQAKGWWGKMDAGLLNKPEDELDRKAKQGFTPQVVMGIGSSMFNLGPQSPSSSPKASAGGAAPAAPEAAAAAVAIADGVKDWDPFGGAADVQTTIVAAPADVVPGTEQASSAAAAACSTEAPVPDARDLVDPTKPAGWWAKMDAGLLNEKPEHALDKKAKQGFTPQFMGQSGLVNRLLPVGGGSMGNSPQVSAGGAPPPAAEEWNPFAGADGK